MSSLYAQGCIDLATRFMRHIHHDLPSDYKLGDLNDEYFIGSASTDYASFADGSCQYIWDCPTIYIALQKNIPYDILCEHFDWNFDYENQYKKPEEWINLEIYAWKRTNHTDMSVKDFQRMLQREHYENQANNLSDACIKQSEDYMRDQMEKFKKDLVEMK